MTSIASIWRMLLTASVGKMNDKTAYLTEPCAPIPVKKHLEESVDYWLMRPRLRAGGARERIFSCLKQCLNGSDD